MQTLSLTDNLAAALADILRNNSPEAVSSPAISAVPEPVPNAPVGIPPAPPVTPYSEPAPRRRSGRRPFRKGNVNYRDVSETTVGPHPGNTQYLAIWFPGKPSDRVREAMKSNHWRFNAFGDGAWTMFNTDAAQKMADDIKWGRIN